MLPTGLSPERAAAAAAAVTARVLDVPDRVLFKLAVTVHRCLNGRAPPYLSWSTASRSPVLTRAGICVPPTVTYLPYRVSRSALTAVGRSQLLAR